MSPEHRIKRLQELIDRMTHGKDVSTRDLKNVLTPEEFADLQAQWASQMTMRDWLRDKPDAVVEYETLLRQANFHYNKAESYSGSSTKSNHRDKNGVRIADKFYNQSQAAFERALEHLTEAAQMDPSLHIWFDRPLEFGLNGNIDLSPEGMPQAGASRSVHRQGDGIFHSVQRKREVKQQALEHSLAALEVPPSEPNTGLQATANLRAFLDRGRR